MSTGAYEIHGVSVYECASDQHPLRTEGDANDLISTAREHNARFLIIRAEHLSSEFFHLKTGLAGAIIQKFITYDVRVAIIGDITEQAQSSSSLSDFVYEANRGKHIWFLKSRAEFEKRLQAERDSQ
ncbi:MAG TPA: DUF4180 domain-containing protein [Terriglobales bacterium]|nr:DUF4180 domain-containing protein [Terriglobales bacterium]